MKLNQRNIKEILDENGLKIWQLCQYLNISRSKYYEYSHSNFRGNEKLISHAINNLIAEHKKASASDAN